MRTAVIITGLFFLSIATYAQQERQLQKQAATAQVNGTANKPANVHFTPAAPKQMAPLGSKPATNSGKPAATPANSQVRQMKPLNPNTVVKNNN